MKGITYTQLAQYCALIVAYTIPAVFISIQLTGQFLPPIGLFSTYVESGLPLLTKLNEVLLELGFNDYTSQHTSYFNMFLFTMSLMIGTAGISPLLFGAIINFAVAYLVMKTANAPPAAIQDLVESIRVPRGAVGAIKH